MQFNPALDHAADIPPAIFPPEAVEDLPPLARTAVVKSYSDLATAPAARGRIPAIPATHKAIRIARAKSGETELRLLAQKVGDVTSYTVRKSRIAPYEYVDTPLGEGKKLTETRARAQFGKLVGSTYPPEILRNKKLVATHVDLL